MSDRARGSEQLQRRGLDGSVSPTMTVDTAARVDRSQKATHFRRGPPVETGDEEIGEEDAVRLERWGLEPHRRRVFAHPRPKGLDGLRVRFGHLHAKGVVGE
eukprot:7376409-Prymnesium_polylepis.3